MNCPLLKAFCSCRGNDSSGQSSPMAWDASARAAAQAHFDSGAEMETSSQGSGSHSSQHPRVCNPPMDMTCPMDLISSLVMPHVSVCHLPGLQTGRNASGAGTWHFAQSRGHLKAAILGLAHCLRTETIILFRSPSLAAGHRSTPWRRRWPRSRSSWILQPPPRWSCRRRSKYAFASISFSLFFSFLC
jgi:hypothetical protein